MFASAKQYSIGIAISCLLIIHSGISIFSFYIFVLPWVYKVALSIEGDLLCIAILAQALACKFLPPARSRNWGWVGGRMAGSGLGLGVLQWAPAVGGLPRD